MPNLNVGLVLAVFVGTCDALAETPGVPELIPLGSCADIMSGGSYAGDAYHICSAIAGMMGTYDTGYVCTKYGYYSGVCSSFASQGFGMPAVVPLNDVSAAPVLVCMDDDMAGYQDELGLCDMIMQRTLMGNEVLKISSQYYSWNTSYTITNYRKFVCEYDEICWDDKQDWTAYTTGVQRRQISRVCQDDGTCSSGTSYYRCASGYYGGTANGSTSVPTCYSCAEKTGLANAMTSPVGGATKITQCYQPVGTYVDAVGTYERTANCFYTEDPDDRLELYYNPCSELIAKSCWVSNTSQAVYNASASGTVFTFKCSGDPDNLKGWLCTKD
ncbi:MAG: hypothetical protein IJ273_00715 [Alphaproteobacteria bacterium]|nr:hypothetical protein [Alphaproteobacteria bacterium]